MHLYRTLSTQRLLPASYEEPLVYTNFVIEKATVVYTEKNPQKIHEDSLHDQKVAVWCGVSVEKVTGPYFFEDSRGQTVTLNGDRYRKMIRDFVIPDLRKNGIGGYGFHQDDATCHTASKTMNLLKEFFGNRRYDY